MVRSKTLLFLGRQDPDTGYRQCEKLAREHGWKLVAIKGVKDVNPAIAKADYVYAGGYLVAAEAFAAKKIVLASYDNPLKKDYWSCHPMASEIGFNGRIPQKYSQKAYKWASSQTWEKLAQLYEELWTK